MAGPVSRSGPLPVSKKKDAAHLFLEWLGRLFRTNRPELETPRERLRKLRERGKTSEAITLCREILARHPEDASVSKMLGDLLAPNDRVRAAGNYLGAAAINARRGFYAQSRALLELAISLDPGNAGAHFQLGEVCVSLQEIPDALTAYSTAAAIADATRDPDRAAQIRARCDEIKSFFPQSRLGTKQTSR